MKMKVQFRFKAGIVLVQVAEKLIVKVEKVVL